LHTFQRVSHWLASSLAHPMFGMEIRCVMGAACFSLALGNSAAPTVTIAPGVNMPMLILGTSVPDMFTYDNCSMQDAVEQWLKVGGRHVLTCVGRCYASEPQIGRAWRASGLPRNEVFITTMVPEPVGRREVSDMILNVSMKNLGVDYIDLVLIKRACVPSQHGPEYPDRCGNDSKDLRLATWQGLMDLRSSGKIRAAGVSNYNAEHIAEILARGERPAVNQVEWHLGFHDDDLLQQMRHWNVTLEGYGVLSGPTTLYGNPGVPLHDSRLIEVAHRYNVSAAQVVLQWTIAKGIAPITATCNAAHAADDFKAFGFSLAAEDVAYLDSLKAQSSMVLM